MENIQSGAYKPRETQLGSLRAHSIVIASYSSTSYGVTVHRLLAPMPCTNALTLLYHRRPIHVIILLYWQYETVTMYMTDDRYEI